MWVKPDRFVDVCLWTSVNTSSDTCISYLKLAVRYNFFLDWVLYNAI